VVLVPWGFPWRWHEACTPLDTGSGRWAFKKNILRRVLPDSVVTLNSPVVHSFQLRVSWYYCFPYARQRKHLLTDLKNSGSKIYRFDGFGRRITTALLRIFLIARSVTIAAALTIALTVSGTAALAADGGGRPGPELQRVALGTGGAVATTHPAATRDGN